MNTRNLNAELYQAIDNLDETRARALLAEGADINAADEDGWPLLPALADAGSDEAVFLCLKLGADPRLEDEDEQTMVFFLLQNGRYELLLECIDRGIIDVNEPNSHGTTPLMWCCCLTYSEELTQALLARGADVHRTDKDGTTAFGYAIDEDICYSEHFPLLLEAGADINSRDAKGRTAVMVYAMGENESPEYIRFFLEHGADVNLRDPEGKTALGYAAANLYNVRRALSNCMNEEWIIEMIEELKTYGAKL